MLTRSQVEREVCKDFCLAAGAALWIWYTEAVNGARAAEEGTGEDIVEFSIA